MWPDSPYARPVGSFRHPVPLVTVDPDIEPDVTVCFRREWLPYIVGALQQLLLQSTWRTDDPDALNLAQARAQLLISLFLQGCPPVPVEKPDGVEFDGEELMPSLCESLRWNDGKLQAFCCGEWTDIPGFGGVVAGGSTQPEPGGVLAPSGCATYNVPLGGKDQYLLPNPVQAGYVITVSGVKGGWTDGTNWFCPDGSIYLLGACNPFGKTHNGTNPSSTAYHMQLVALINGIYYPIQMGADTVITVPAGTPASEVTFQANNTPIGDNSGSITFNVQVCAPAASGSSVSVCYPAGGSGPATVQKGVPFTVASGANPNGHQVITLGFDANVTLTIKDEGSWQERTASGDTVYAFNTGQNACDINHIFAGTIVQVGTAHLPLQLTCSCLYIDSQNSGWSMQFQID